MNIQKPHRGLHQVGDEQPAIHARLPEGMESEDLAMFNDVTNADELIAAFQNFKAKKKGVAPRSPTGHETLLRSKIRMG